MSDQSVIDPTVPVGPATALAGVVARFPGPAFVIKAAGTFGAINEQAHDLRQALEAGLADDVAAQLRATRATGASGQVTYRLPESLGGAWLDLSFVAGDAAEAPYPILVLGRDISLERNLRHALVESRQRYKDLVECSADFAWETGADGRFVFVSPRGALGYTADQLVGRHGSEFLVEGPDPDEILPFDSHQPTQNVELAVRRGDDNTAWLQVSSVPLLRSGGEWEGARGICRDITREHEQDIALERARQRDRALAEVIGDIRRQIALPEVLAAAARATAEALEAESCWVYPIGAAGEPDPPTRYPPDRPDPPEAVLAWVRRAGRARQQETTGVIGNILLASAHDAQRTNAVIAVRRSADAGAWPADSHTLLLAVANQLGVAIEQATIHEQLQVLSRTDGLTGMLNRRAFLDEAGRRMGHATRTRRPGALLYIDANNFKAVNDMHGHYKGDDLLRDIAAMISDSGRAGDIAARIGGDEFILWLDETTPEGAETKARLLVERAAALSDYSGSPDKPFGLAIGVATFDPESDADLPTLLDAADKAMYGAKQMDASSAYVMADVMTGDPANVPDPGSPAARSPGAGSD